MIFTILSCFLVSGQTRISGIVKDKITREPLAGASVFVPNTTNGGATDENGFFSFTLRENQLELLISYIGYESVMVPTASFAATAAHFSASSGSKLAPCASGIGNTVFMP